MIVKWISVKKRLPDENQEVLVCNYIKNSYFLNGMWCPQINVNRYARLFKDGECMFLDVQFRSHNPTHWRPLPAAPIKQSSVGRIKVRS
jgi:hypothetical protein